MGLFDVLKTTAIVLKEANRIDLYNQILDVQNQLLDMNKTINDLESENNKLKEKLKIKEQLIYEDNTYWIMGEGNKKDGPFCTRCWDKNFDLIRLHHTDENSYKICLECKNGVRIGQDESSDGSSVW